MPRGQGKSSPARLAKAKRYYDRNREAVCARSRQWRLDNPERARYNDRSKALYTKFGITVEDFDQMLLNQGGRCALCRSEKSGGQGTFHVDHCHASGKVRGLLCAGCNLALGHYEKLTANPDVVAYLKGEHCAYGTTSPGS